jgi:hypothetical protein
VIGLAPFDQHIDIGELLGARNCDDSLMGVGLGGAIELLASQEPDLDSAGAARVDKALHALIVALTRNSDIIHAAGA